MKNSLILSVLSVTASAATLNFDEPTYDRPRRHQSKYSDLWDDITASRDSVNRPAYSRRSQELPPSHSAASSADDFRQFVYEEPSEVAHNHYFGEDLGEHTHGDGDSIHSHGPGTSDSFYTHPEPVHEEPAYTHPEPVHEEPAYNHHEPVHEEPTYAHPEPVHEESAYTPHVPVHEAPVYTPPEPVYERPTPVQTPQEPEQEDFSTYSRPSYTPRPAYSPPKSLYEPPAPTYKPAKPTYEHIESTYEPATPSYYNPEPELPLYEKPVPTISRFDRYKNRTDRSDHYIVDAEAYRLREQEPKLELAEPTYATRHDEPTHYIQSHGYQSDHEQYEQDIDSYKHREHDRYDRDDLHDDHLQHLDHLNTYDRDDHHDSNDHQDLFYHDDVHDLRDLYGYHDDHHDDVHDQRDLYGDHDNHSRHSHYQTPDLPYSPVEPTADLLNKNDYSAFDDDLNHDHDTGLPVHDHSYLGNDPEFDGDDNSRFRRHERNFRINDRFGDHDRNYYESHSAFDGYHGFDAEDHYQHPLPANDWHYYDNVKKYDDMREEWNIVNNPSHPDYDYYAYSYHRNLAKPDRMDYDIDLDYEAHHHDSEVFSHLVPDDFEEAVHEHNVWEPLFKQEEYETHLETEAFMMISLESLRGSIVELLDDVQTLEACQDKFEHDYDHILERFEWSPQLITEFKDQQYRVKYLQGECRHNQVELDENNDFLVLYCQQYAFATDMVKACADLLTCRSTELDYRWDWGYNGHNDNANLY